MPLQRTQLAAPPDDGGTSGSDTEPVQGLQAEASDTRSSETIGEQPRHAPHPNRGLMLFFATTVLLVIVLLLMLAYLKAG
jgi:hypothetical protein